MTESPRRMAYLTRKRIKGVTYYYAEEKEWVDGKARRTWQKYLGPLPKLLAALESGPPKPGYAEIFELGCPAAYHHVAQELGILAKLDGHFPKRQQGLALSFYLLLAAMNRGIEPVSKRSMWSWFQDTVFLRLFPQATKEGLSSQRFWDNMSQVAEERLKGAWMEIVVEALEREQVALSDVAFDGTNFYSFIGSFNSRCSLAQRGKNKQGRNNLRQVSYALFCTRQDHVPLFYEVYEGNRHEAKRFARVLDQFFEAFKKQSPQREGITLVFDKGNNSKDNLQKFVEDSGYHFVGSVKPCEHKELATIPNTDGRLKKLDEPRLEEVKAFRCQKKIYGKDLTVIVTFNNHLYTAQLMTLNVGVNKCLDKLATLSKKLEDRREGRITKGKPPTVQSVEKQVAAILSGQHMKKLIRTKVTEEKGIPALSYGLLTDIYTQLCATELGKNLIITDNHHWSTPDIILAYRSQYVIEDIFKQMKDRKMGSWWPMFHWTDQKIQVHAFYCSLALLLRALIMKKARQAGISISMSRLHERLSDIREVVNVYNQGNQKKTSQSVVSKMDHVQQRLFELFEMEHYLSS